ncbi:MAG: hypothetical protein DLM68_14545 [Hyphomicrobiales bacterium]|nr:MAG: hypothetical protein DLM68_14545 [Hyphomicrobiales bacterium]
MGQVLRGCARTTAAVRRTIQQSQKSLNVLAEFERELIRVRTGEDRERAVANGVRLSRDSLFGQRMRFSG